MSLRDTYEMACPKCGQDKVLHVVVSLWAELTADGTDPDAPGLPGYDHDWDENSTCICPECEFVGRANDFVVENAASSFSEAKQRAKAACEGKDRDWLLANQRMYMEFCNGNIMTHDVCAMLEEIHERLGGLQ